jgi:hypothetical protein
MTQYPDAPCFVRPAPSSSCVLPSSFNALFQMLQWKESAMHPLVPRGLDDTHALEARRSTTDPSLLVTVHSSPYKSCSWAISAAAESRITLFIILNRTLSAFLLVKWPLDLIFLCVLSVTWHVMFLLCPTCSTFSPQCVIDCGFSQHYIERVLSLLPILLSNGNTWTSSSSR